MAEQVRTVIYGVDVAKATLEVASGEEGGESIANEARAIERWLRSLAAPACLAVEATGRYHEELVEQALSAGHRVYLIDGKQLHHYREAVGPRAKTDAEDARLLWRYLAHEHQQLRPISALGEGEKRLWRLLKRRAALVRIRKQLQASMSGLREMEELTGGVVKDLRAAVRELERMLRQQALDLGWGRELGICRSVPGIGELNALALVSCYHRGEFSGADQFIAFLGLDVRVKDSGQMRGKRKLTKRGEPELRRLLYNAAMSFARDPRYRALYDRLVAKGRSSTAAHVILARKLARVAFSLLRQGEWFDPTRFRACATT